jgi:hypothetical protein
MIRFIFVLMSDICCDIHVLKIKKIHDLSDPSVIAQKVRWKNPLFVIRTKGYPDNAKLVNGRSILFFGSADVVWHITGEGIFQFLAIKRNSDLVPVTKRCSTQCPLLRNFALCSELWLVAISASHDECIQLVTLQAGKDFKSTALQILFLHRSDLCIGEKTANFQFLAQAFNNGIARIDLLIIITNPNMADIKQND